MIATVLGSPVTGLQVNSTPETSASTIRCTVTPISGVPAPIRSRYAVARSLWMLPQQSWTACSTASPLTCRNVSCMPAKVASAPSSPTALERTATAPPRRS